MTPENEINRQINPNAVSFRYREVTDFEDLSPSESRVIGGNKDGAFAGTSKSGVHFAGATNIGFGLESLLTSQNKYASNHGAIFKVERQDGTIFLGLADGIRGKNADSPGDIASGTLTSSLAYGLIKNQDRPVSDLIRIGEYSLMQAYEFQRDLEKQGSSTEGPYKAADMANMKTCLCMLELRPKDGLWQAIPYNIGNSRLIIFTVPPFVTVENNAAVEHGLLPEDLKFNQYVNSITKCLGLKYGKPRDMELDPYDPILITPGTRFLIASDCLSDNLPFKDISLIEEAVNRAAPGTEGSKQIVKEMEMLIRSRANINNADNFGVIAGQVGDSAR